MADYPTPTSYPFLDTGDMASNPEGFTRGTTFQNSAYKFNHPLINDEWFVHAAPWFALAGSAGVLAPYLIAAAAGSGGGAATAPAVAGSTAGEAAGTGSVAMLPASYAGGPGAATMGSVAPSVTGVSAAAPAATAGTTAGTGAVAGWHGVTAGNAVKAAAMAPTVYSAFKGRGGAPDSGSTQQGINDLIAYQKYLMAMTNPTAASYLGIQVPQGARPIREAMTQALYAMMPTFARQGLPNAAPTPTNTAPPQAVPRERKIRF